ncbi:hypothetical protein KFK09_003591 [Dendrobium nobile]|uniref:Uncharacterized protein n=1 Tax=Dendrobium nobile TaxID=94219 RepID=A0A8T3C3G4_DENNO|nr:hypothetical protein KFK09_003591 [Dendrobium nobile]
MKQQLAGVKGNIAVCKKVPHDEELDSTPFPVDDAIDEERDSCSLPKTQSSHAHVSELSKGKRKASDIDTFFAPRTTRGAQPSIKSALASKEVVHRVDMALARWFFYCCIPFNALTSIYAQKAVDAIAAIGPGYKLPSYHNMRVNLLRDCKEECMLLIDSYRQTWKETGCTLMADGWTDSRSRTLINFLIYCPRGIAFLKSVDASDITKDATTLCSLFAEVVEWVGPESVVQIVTDNAANYKKFWDNCLIISKIAGPLIRLLRIVDSDEKPSLGYLYDGMYRARKAIKAMFKNVKRSYKSFTTIIKRRWDTQIRQGIHAAAYFLNPHFQYDRENYCQKTGILQGLVELIGNKDICSKPTIAMNEVRLFRDGLESFGKPIALTMPKEMQPDEWWKMFGSSAPNLQKVAIRILSQTSSSSGCERNWSVFEQIHSKRRNYLEHQRLNDLVYVRYNLNLKNRFQLKKRHYDPLNYTCVEMVDFWILEDEATPELDLQDLENEIYKVDAIPVVEEQNISFDQPGHCKLTMKFEYII